MELNKSDKTSTKDLNREQCSDPLNAVQIKDHKIGINFHTANKKQKYIFWALRSICFFFMY